MSLGRATQAQWKDFIQTMVYRDLKEFLLEVIELNRDLLEGQLTQNEALRETDEALRGRNRDARELIARIEGWADSREPADGQ